MRHAAAPFVERALRGRSVDGEPSKSAIQTDHDRRRRAQPATRPSRVCGDTHIAGALDEMPKAMVVASLSAGRGRHDTIIGRFLTPLNP